MEGSIGYSSQSGVGGQLALASAAVKFSASRWKLRAIRFGASANRGWQDRAGAHRHCDGGRINPPKWKANTRSTTATLTSASARAQLTIGDAHLFDAAAIPPPIPIIEQLHQGVLEGLDFATKRSPRIPPCGRVSMNCKMPSWRFRGLPSPVRLAPLRCRWMAAKFKSLACMDGPAH